MNQPLSLADRKQLALEYLKSVLKVYCPKRTYNLSLNGIVIIDDDSIGIGGENAPYAAATNEPWTDDQWHGKKNPNEGWIQRAIESALPYLKQIYSGAIAQEEAEQLINKNINDFDAQKEAKMQSIEKKE